MDALSVICDCRTSINDSHALNSPKVCEFGEDLSHRFAIAQKTQLVTVISEISLTFPFGLRIENFLVWRRYPLSTVDNTYTILYNTNIHRRINWKVVLLIINNTIIIATVIKSWNRKYLRSSTKTEDLFVWVRFVSQRFNR